MYNPFHKKTMLEKATERTAKAVKSVAKAAGTGVAGLVVLGSLAFDSSAEQARKEELEAKANAEKLYDARKKLLLAELDFKAAGGTTSPSVVILSPETSITHRMENDLYDLQSELLRDQCNGFISCLDPRHDVIKKLAKDIDDRKRKGY
jgi:hypothetical protein